MSEEHASSERGPFVADLALSLLLGWLVLWRVQLIGAGAATFWLTAKPLAVALGFVLLALALGYVVKTARGFLPFALRWLLLAGTTILLVWAIVDLVSRPDSSDPVAAIESKAREDARVALAAAKTPEDKQVAEQMVATADALEDFGELVDVSVERGRVEPVESSPTPTASTGAEAAALLRSYGPALAAGELPAELAPVAQELGLDGQDLMMKVGMALATRVIAEYFGMPYVIAFKILIELLDDGELSPGEIIHLATAVALSVDDTGLDIEALGQHFEQVEGYAQTLSTIMAEAERLGFDEQFDPTIWSIGRELTDEVAGIDTECDAQAVAEVLAQTDQHDEQIRLLSLSDNQACRELSRSQLSALLERQRR